jgi:predicted permease
MRQLLTECLALAALGTALGVGVAYVGVKLFLLHTPIEHSRLDDAHLDATALGFAATIGVVTSLLFGLMPALQASGVNLRQTLGAGGRDGHEGVRERVRRWLVAGQVALAVVMLTAAGLMVRSFLRVHAVEMGFRPDNVLAFDVQLPAARYSKDPDRVQFFEGLEARLQHVPGVAEVGGVTHLPLDGGDNWSSFTVEGNPPLEPGKEPGAERRWITPGYFATMGISLRQGRAFQATDTKSQPLVVIVNETLARQHFGARVPVGLRIKVGVSPTASWRTVVGVVSDVKSSSLEGDAHPQLYLPNAQWTWGAMTIVLRTEANPLAFRDAIRREVRAMDPLLPAAKVRTMKQVVWNAASERRFNMSLLVFFGGAALLLTAFGLYGVVAFLVGSRRREIGIRIALGAESSAIYGMVIAHGMKPALAGMAIGMAASVASAHAIASQLYAISASDPTTLACIISLLLTASLLACWLPARHAVKVDPMVALRCE